MLVKKIVTSALSTLGVLGLGEEPRAEEHQQGLVVLNELIDYYNAQGLFITHSTTLSFQPPQKLNPCTAPDSENTEREWKYTIEIGECKDYNIVAPIDISLIYLRDSLTNIDTILDRITVADTMNPSIDIPSGVWVEIGDRRVKLTFNGLPKKTDILYLVCKLPYRGELLENGKYDLYDDINFDYGIERVLRLNLAVELAPHYGIQVNQLLLAQAEDAKSEIKNKGYLLQSLVNDVGLK